MTNPYRDAEGEYRPRELSPIAEAHPAYAVARASWRAANAKDRDAWLSVWAENGCVEDPVGPSMFDPEGVGHRGRARLEEFWDKAVSAPDHIQFRFDRATACGDELLCCGTIRTEMGENVMDAAGAVVYRVDAEGRLVSLRAFWETDTSFATLRPLTEEDRT